MPEYDEELDRIVREHTFVTSTVHAAFNDTYDRLLERFGSEGYDGGDAFFDAEQQIGINPWDVTTHQGLVALVSAVSLTEVTLARLAASWLSTRTTSSSATSACGIGRRNVTSMRPASERLLILRATASENRYIWV